MSLRRRLYCRCCRRSLSPKAFNLELWEELSYQICEDCMERLQAPMATPATVDNEVTIQKALHAREGGEMEVETPVGFVDLITNEYVIEVKHVIDWKDATKVLLYAHHFPSRKPRVHLFGGHSKTFRELVEKSFADLSIAVTWEQDAY
jgi:hypothetical protein